MADHRQMLLIITVLAVSLAALIARCSDQRLHARATGVN